MQTFSKLAALTAASFLVVATISAESRFSTLSKSTHSHNIKYEHLAVENVQAFVSSTVEPLRISEIMFDPPESGADSLEYIEIYNEGATAVNLQGFSVSVGVNFTFGNVSLPANAFVVIAKDSMAVFRQFGVSAYQWSGVLANTGEALVLKNSTGVVLDSVEYSNKSAWPNAAKGNGASIVLCDFSLDPNLGSSWQASSNGTGIIINGHELVGSPGGQDASCVSCPPADTTYIVGPTCDISEAGVSYQILLNGSGCDSVVSNTLLHDPGYIEVLPLQSICEGDSIFLFGAFRTEAGIFRDTLQNINACDSVLQQSLVVNPIDTTFLDSATTDLAQVRSDTVWHSSTRGCDSVVVVNWMFQSPVAGSLRITEIMYDPPESGRDVREYIEIFNPGSVPVDLSGYYLDGVTYTFGSHILAPLARIVVANDSLELFNNFGWSAYQWTSGALTNSGEALVVRNPFGELVDSVRYRNTGSWPSAANGDGPSLVLCDLSLDPNDGSSWQVSASGTGIMINGHELKGSPGGQDAACVNCPAPDTSFTRLFVCDSSLADTVFTTHTTAQACDSVAAVISVYAPGSLTSLPAAEVCAGDSAIIHGHYQNSAGVYWDTLTTVYGCDSIVQQELLVHLVTTDTLSLITICPGDSMWIFGEYERLPGFYSHTFISSQGCDSTLTTELVLGADYLLADTAYICAGDSAFIFGEYRATAGVYSDSSFTAFGCDSVTSIELIVQASASGTATAEICPGDSVFAGGSWQTSAGVYYDTLVGVNSCDSIAATSVFFKTIHCDTTIAPAQGDSLVIVSDSTWWESTVVSTANANWSTWPGISGKLPAASSYTLPVVTGNRTDKVVGTQSINSESGIHFFRKTFELTIDTGVQARIRGYMDDGMEVYLNGHLIAREENRSKYNRQGTSHDLMFFSNGIYENGYQDGDGFDFVSTYRLDSLVHTGTNELVIALQNKNGGDKGGFSFRMDMHTKVPVVPELTHSVVSDMNWRQSSVITSTPNWVSNWGGVSSLPAQHSFNQPLSFELLDNGKGIFEVEGSYPVIAGGNITYYRSSFELSDAADVNVRIRSTFDEMVEIYLNDQVLVRANQLNANNRKLPGHDILFKADGTVENAHSGGMAFDYIAAVDLDSVLRRGLNTVTVVLRNRPTGKGGFSFRMDLDQNGNPVIVKKRDTISNIPSSPDDFSIDVFPNPTRGELYAVPGNIPDDQALELRVVDFNGRLVHRENYQRVIQGTRLDVDLSALPKGVYVLQFLTGDGFVARLVVLE